ncbi:hypothetical protein GCM10022206_16890 [Streptomyces chiangmaiensis]
MRYPGSRTGTGPADHGVATLCDHREACACPAITADRTLPGQRIALESYDRIVGLVLDQNAVDGSIVQMPPVPRSGLPAAWRVGVGHQPAHKQISAPNEQKGPSAS